jgi:hypothetical protein
MWIYFYRNRYTASIFEISIVRVDLRRLKPQVFTTSRSSPSSHRRAVPSVPACQRTYGCRTGGVLMVDRWSRPMQAMLGYCTGTKNGHGHSIHRLQVKISRSHQGRIPTAYRVSRSRSKAVGGTKNAKIRPGRHASTHVRTDFGRRSILTLV